MVSINEFVLRSLTNLVRRFEERGQVSSYERDKMKERGGRNRRGGTEEEKRDEQDSKVREGAKL